MKTLDDKIHDLDPERDEELAALVPAGMREEFDRFKEIFI